MKGRVAAALAAVMLLGIGVAVAVGGLNGEAMISRSYFEDVYLPDLSAGLRSRAEKDMEPIFTQVQKALYEHSQEIAKQAAGSPEKEIGYASVQLDGEDGLELTFGSAVIPTDGGCRLIAGTLADVTQGMTLESGKTLTADHRYIVTSTAGAALRQTEGGTVLYQGAGTVNRTGTSSSGTPNGGAETGFPFVDVPGDMWYRDAVAFVYEKGYFAGTAADTFSPDAPMDRAMVATVLHRVSGGQKVTSGVEFTDVPAGQWYSGGIAWASANGVVNGMGGGLYAPHQPVTREQLVTMLYRYQKDYRKADVSGSASLDSFSDAQAVSAWARESVSWAVGAGLIKGRDTGCLDPAGTATRAEVATILQRFSAGL